jgi:hypothetical protein
MDVTLPATMHVRGMETQSEDLDKATSQKKKKTSGKTVVLRSQLRPSGGRRHGSRGSVSHGT